MLTQRIRTAAVACFAIALAFTGCSSGEDPARRTTGAREFCSGAAVGLGTTPEAASAAMKRESTNEVEVAAGATLYAVGSGFDVRCGEPAQSGEDPQGVRLFIAQNSRSVSVARVNTAGADDQFSVSFGVPEDLAAGAARVEVRRSVEPDGLPIVSEEFSVTPAP